MSRVFPRSIFIIAALLSFGYMAQAQERKVDLAAEEAKIRELDARFPRLLNAKDVDGIIDLMAEDAIELTSKTDADGHPIRVEGRKAIRDLHKKFVEITPSLKAVGKATKIEIAKSGDLAYVVGDYELTFDDPGGRMRDKGRYAFVLRKEKDEWKIVLHAGTASVWMREGDLPSGGPRIHHQPSRYIDDEEKSEEL